MLFILALLIPSLYAYLFIKLLWPSQNISMSLHLLQANLAIGLGIGSSSILFFFLFYFLKYNPFHLILVDMILGVCLLILFGVLLFRKTRLKNPFLTNHNPPTPCSVEIKTNNNPNDNVAPRLKYAFYLILLFSILFFILRSLNYAHGSWDAWSMWNLKARFIFRGGPHWLRLFSTDIAWSHPDYPLLIPFSIARLWYYSGHETFLSPVLLAFVYTYGAFSLIVLSLHVFYSPASSYFAGIFFLSITYFFRHGASQVADIPISYYFSAVIVLLYAHYKLHDLKSGSLPALVGVFLGLSAWTKNEGLLFIVLTVSIHFFMILRASGIRRAGTEIFHISLGLIPIFMFIIFYKFAFTPPNDLFESQTLSSIIDKGIHLDRYFIVSKIYIQKFIEIFKVRLLLFPLIVFIMGRSFKKMNTIQLELVYILSFMLLGYFFIYILSPHDLNWHVNASVKRLMIQLLPSAFFVLFIHLTPLKNGVNHVQVNHVQVNNAKITVAT